MFSRCCVGDCGSQNSVALHFMHVGEGMPIFVYMYSVNKLARVIIVVNEQIFVYISCSRNSVCIGPTVKSKVSEHKYCASCSLPCTNM